MVQYLIQKPRSVTVCCQKCKRVKKLLLGAQCAGMRIYENFRIAQTPFHVKLQGLRRKMSKIFFECVNEKKIFIIG